MINLAEKFSIKKIFGLVLIIFGFIREFIGGVESTHYNLSTSILMITSSIIIAAIGWYLVGWWKWR
jgi:lipopolysaccharide export LptBFGC system permease protein LptF